MSLPDYEKAFSWLNAQIATINTPDFHKFQEVELTDEPVPYFKLPPHYRAFVNVFGNAQLFNEGSYYQMKILAPPRIARNPDYLIIGFWDDETVYLHIPELQENQEAPVYHGYEGEEPEQVADDFLEWLLEYSEIARENFTDDEWEAIEKGPKPFSKKEQKIVEARRLYSWELLGYNDDGDTEFRITNGSDMQLPFFTLDVHARDRSVNGRIFLSVRDIAPGESGVTSRDCYKKLIPRGELIVEDAPDPRPGEQKRYWEFR